MNDQYCWWLVLIGLTSRFIIQVTSAS